MDDDFRLGRGLESLIPPQKGNGQGDDQKPEPQTEPDRLLPKEPERPELPPEPTEPELPSPGVPQTDVPAEQPTGQVAAETPAAPAPAVLHRDPEPPKPYEAVFQIEIDKIKPNPDQPRKNFDEDGLRDLASSIREFGILQPLVVTKVEREVPTGTEVEYVLISGERRLMASKLLHLERVPAIVRNVGFDRERLELAIIENIQRENLNPIETARAMSRLQDEFRLTQREIAARLGKSREVIANSVRLLDLPPKIQEAIEQGRISESHGRLLLSIPEPGLQDKLFRDLLERGMTTRELRNRVDAAKPRQRSLHEPAAELTPELKMLQEKLSAELGAPVKIQQEANGGKITISFYSEEELRGILSRLSSRHPDGF